MATDAAFSILSEDRRRRLQGLPPIGFNLGDLLDMEWKDWLLILIEASLLIGAGWLIVRAMSGGSA